MWGYKNGGCVCLNHWLRHWDLVIVIGFVAFVCWIPKEGSLLLFYSQTPSDIGLKEFEPPREVSPFLCVVEPKAGFVWRNLNPVRGFVFCSSIAEQQARFASRNLKPLEGVFFGLVYLNPKWGSFPGIWRPRRGFSCLLELLNHKWGFDERIWTPL